MALFTPLNKFVYQAPDAPKSEDLEFCLVLVVCGVQRRKGIVQFPVIPCGSRGVSESCWQ